MLGPASFPLPRSASFVKSRSWEKDESIIFEDEARIPQSQVFLLKVVKPTWNGNQRWRRKVRGTFRHSDYLEGELQVEIENPLSYLFEGFMVAALKDSFRQELMLPVNPGLQLFLSPLHWVRSHWNFSSSLPLPKLCSFTIYPQGAWRWHWFCQRRRRGGEGKWESSTDSMKPHDPPIWHTWLFICLPSSRTLAITCPQHGSVSPSFLGWLRPWLLESKKSRGGFQPGPPTSTWEVGVTHGSVVPQHGVNRDKCNALYQMPLTSDYSW